MRTPQTAVKGLNHWVITVDHLHADNVKDGDAPILPGQYSNAVGVYSNHCPFKPYELFEAFKKGDDAPDPTKIDYKVLRADIDKLAKKNGLTLKFRLLDDDGNLYYEGRMVPFEAHGDDSDGFEPLDDFGKPNAGAVTLEYWKHNTGWVTL